MKKVRFIAFVVAVIVTLGSFAYDYNVRPPSDDLKPTFALSDTQPGKWTLQVDDAIAKAKAAGKYTLVLNTASWWCPHCELLEEKVLTSAAWKKYVADSGFYLGMLDFPYRLDVPADQLWKSWRPELGKGWGFKCWMMSPDYLSSIGYTQDQGLAFIMDQYRWQQKLGEVDRMDTITITNPLDKTEFTYGKVGYPSIIVYDPTGKEIGRKLFQSWLRQENVTDAEAQEEAIQAIEKIISGKCKICEDPVAGVPPTDKAQTYDGWVVGPDGIAGTVSFKLSKAGRDGNVRVSGSAKIGNMTIRFATVSVSSPNASVPLAKGTDQLGSVVFGETGLAGSVTVEGRVYELNGGRNVFKAKDEAAQLRALTCPEGIWNVILKPPATITSSFECGYGTLSVSVGNKGKTKVSGRLADGTSVSVSAQAIVGADGKVCVPVVANLYSRRGGLGFVVWFKDGVLYDIDDVAPWIAAGKNEFVSKYTTMAARESGFGTVPEELELLVTGMTAEQTIGGLPIVNNPLEDIVEVLGTQWKGSEYTRFKATCNAKTGILKGSAKLILDRGNGRTMTVTATVYGAVMSGTGYGTMVVRNEGSWPVKIMVCSGCSD